MSDLKWTPVTIRLGQVKPWQDNPRMSTKAQAERLIQSERELGQVQTIAIGPAEDDGRYPLYDGHQRYAAWFTVKGASYELTALQSNRPLTEDERRKMAILLHTASGGWAWDKMAGWQVGELKEWGLVNQENVKGWNTDANNVKEILKAEQAESVDAEPQIDRAAELLEKWQVKTGDLWKIGEHRLICGDCTDAVTVSRLLSGVTVALVHADPPYGMGFEIDGIANDNLYREDLDTFQMAWWKACRPLIANNASVYIWGWEDSLFSFYLLLRDNKTDRITKRNYIIWNKGSGEGMRQESLRRFAPVTEHCLFFMLGEQGFNNNADNYWHGWDNVKDYLKGEADKVGLTPSKLQEICGVGMYSHWFTESQWTFITEEHYKKLQNAFKKDYDAFKKDYDELKKDYDELKKDYDELKKDFYATRAYFDNTHDNMTDVWDFGRVTGEERMGHATPKPVAMMERVIKSSSPIGAAVFVPFLGTAPEMVAAENTGRVVYGMDLEPAYCAVTLERMADAFPDLEIRRL